MTYAIQFHSREKPNFFQMFSDVSVVACKAATAVHDKMKLLSSDSMIIG